MKSPPQHLDQYGDCFRGEDRSFGGSRFYVEMIPASSWFKNLRAMTTPSQWMAISGYVKQRAGNRCEICGSDLLLEARERWHFDETSKTQRLVRLICLCELCHLGTHWGVTGSLGISGIVRRHILSITGWSNDELSNHLEERRAEQPSDAAWTLDLSIVEFVVNRFQDCGPAVQRKRQDVIESLSTASNMERRSGA